MNGLPPIIPERESSIKDFLEEANCAIEFKSVKDLAEKLSDVAYLQKKKQCTLENRHKFSMQYEFANNVKPFMERFL
jgi:hypothetical protein